MKALTSYPKKNILALHSGSRMGHEIQRMETGGMGMGTEMWEREAESHESGVREPCRVFTSPPSFQLQLPQLDALAHH